MTISANDPSSARLAVPLLPELLTVAIDGGTTNTRARLLRGRELLAEAGRSVGARDVATRGEAGSLKRAVRDVIAEVCAAGEIEKPDRIVACGMMTSEVGLHAVPHVPTPASLDDLTRGCVLIEEPDVASLPILLVPGVKTVPEGGPEHWADADVMRGEECEAIGLWFDGVVGGEPERAKPDARIVFVLPGSHTKLLSLAVRDGKPTILASHTTMAGEILASLAHHTILAASLPESLPRDLDPEAVAAGIDQATRSGLGRAAFLVRIAALTRNWSADQRAAFLIGAVAGDDVHHLSRHPLLDPNTEACVVVGGSPPLRDIYLQLLTRQLARPPVAGNLSYATAMGAAVVAAHRHPRPR